MIRPRARVDPSTTRRDVRSPEPTSSSRAARTMRRSTSGSIMDSRILPHAPGAVNRGARPHPGNSLSRNASSVADFHASCPVTPAANAPRRCCKSNCRSPFRTVISRVRIFACADSAPPSEKGDPGTTVAPKSVLGCAAAATGFRSPGAARACAGESLGRSGFRDPLCGGGNQLGPYDLTRRVFAHVAQGRAPPMKSFSTCLLVLVFLAFSPAPAAAQEVTTGTITGQVTDLVGRPIAEAVVIVVSESGTRTTTTDANGRYIVPFLRPGTYTVRVEASAGFTTVIKSDIAVALNQRVTLNFTLEPGKTETVTVTAAAPLIDVTSTATGTSLKYDDFANAVPLGRSFTDTYAVAPGVVSGLVTGQGNYSISGATGLENSYLIDGVNITNTGFGGIGAYNIVYGSLGTGVTSEFLDQVQIKTGGFESEYGQALGGISNTIVKSGTNDFKGSVSWYSSPSSLQSSRQLIKLDGGASNRVNEDVQDFAFSVGGPFVKDKLFYFFAFNPVITTQRNQANSIVNPGFASAQACHP